MKSRSGYYDHFDLLPPRKHEWRNKFWGREVPLTYSTLSLGRNAKGKALFEAAVARFGPA